MLYVESVPEWDDEQGEGGEREENIPKPESFGAAVVGEFNGKGKGEFNVATPPLHKNFK